MFFISSFLFVLSAVCFSLLFGACGGPRKVGGFLWDTVLVASIPLPSSGDLLCFGFVFSCVSGLCFHLVLRFSVVPFWCAVFVRCVAVACSCGVVVRCGMLVGCVVCVVVSRWVVVVWWVVCGVGVLVW